MAVIPNKSMKDTSNKNVTSTYVYIKYQESRKKSN